MSGKQGEYETFLSAHLKAGGLYEDDTFVADDSSLYFSKTMKNDLKDQKIVWKRPKEIVESPKFFVDGYGVFDIKQGYLGNCWFLAAASALTLKSCLFDRVVLADNSFDDGKYAGIFHFKFFEFGKEIEVIIDDRLPVGADGKCVFAQPSADEGNEFWGPLLEKAYAKFHRSYEAIVGGQMREAFDHMTGVFSETVRPSDMEEDKICEVVGKVLDTGGLVCLGSGSGCEFKGIIGSHAYTVSGLVSKKLFKIRNPHATNEWKGDWSDACCFWENISPERKKELGYENKDNGEFFMCAKDVLSHFTQIDICYSTPDQTCDFEEKKPQEGAIDKEDKPVWYNWAEWGEWIEGKSDGGSSEYIWTFANNPQYQLNVGDLDLDDDDEKHKVVVDLQQTRYKKRARTFMDEDFVEIGVTMFKIKNFRTNKMEAKKGDFFEDKQPLELTAHFEGNARTTVKLQLEIGTYIIVPSTKSPGQWGKFYLKVFSDTKINVMRLNP